MDTLLCNDDGDIVIGTYDPSNTLLRLSADQYTAGSATWTDQSGNGLNFTVSTNTSLKGTDADGFPYMNFGGSYGIAKRIVSSALTNITAPTTNKYTIFCVTQILNSTTPDKTLIRGASEDHQIYIANNSNNLGLYDNSGSNFVDSGFDVTTAMTSSRNLLTWELSTSSPIYNFQLNESGTNSTITSATNYTLPFCCIGGYHNFSTVITTSSQYWGNIYEFIVYDGVLSASERDYVAEYLAYKWDISSKLPSLTSTHGVITALQLLDISGIVGWYLPENWTGTQWTDASGAGNHATAVEGTINYAMHDGSSVGAQRTFPVLYGGTTAEINFPSAILPTNYTLIALTRYNGAAKKRILDGQNINWLSGHWSGRSGIAYHNGWLTNQTDRHGSKWVLGTDQNSLYRSKSEGIAWEESTGGGGASANLRLGSVGYEASDWMCAELIVYNRILSSGEYTMLEGYMQFKYGIE
jgi:hypothetical protein